MPKKPIKMKDTLDRFYTKDEVALSCLNLLSKYTNKDDLYVEPSAGGGAFYRQITNEKVGLDLSPNCEGVISYDWLDFDTPDNSVVVGNPPFGSRNSLSKKFITKACEKAKIVAFILPSSYRKETTQRVFCEGWGLVESVDLPSNSFLLEGEDYHAPCVFQVWLNKNKAKQDFTDLRESNRIRKQTEDFTFVSKKQATHFVFGASPSKVINVGDVTPNNRGYYVSFKNNNVMESFKLINWKAFANSTVSGGVAWYSKNEIIQIYIQEIENENCRKYSGKIQSEAA